MPVWKWGAAILLIAGVMFFVFLSPGEELDPELAGRPGAAAYEKYCLRCHGAHGDGVKALRLADRPLDLSSPAFADTTTLESVRRTVTLGRGKMRGYRDKLTPDEIDAVSRFVLDLAPPWE